MGHSNENQNFMGVFLSFKLYYFFLVFCLMVIMLYAFCGQGKISNVNTVSNVIHRGSQLDS